jgi:hypothetical protein
MDPISLLEEEKNTDFLQDFYKNKIISILDSQREINPVKDPLSVLNEERKRPSFQETKQNKKT